MPSRVRRLPLGHQSIASARPLLWRAQKVVGYASQGSAPERSSGNVPYGRVRIVQQRREIRRQPFVAARSDGRCPSHAPRGKRPLSRVALKQPADRRRRIPLVVVQFGGGLSVPALEKTSGPGQGLVQ